MVINKINSGEAKKQVSTITLRSFPFIKHFLMANLNSKATQYFQNQFLLKF